MLPVAVDLALLAAMGAGVEELGEFSERDSVPAPVLASELTAEAVSALSVASSSSGKDWRMALCQESSSKASWNSCLAWMWV